MKVAILSDFHLGYERFFEDAFNQAKEALSKASELADMLIIPGDIFDYRKPEPEVMAQAVNLFREASQKNYSTKVVDYTGEKLYTTKPIIAIPGTHERRAEDSIDSVDVLHLAGLLVEVNKSKAVIQKGNERVSVYGLGGIADERFRSALKELDLNLDKNTFNIFMIHQTLYELLPFSEEFTHIEELPEGFDLYVNGHIHSKKELKCHGKNFLIPGSTVLTQLKGEEQEEKGFIIYDTESNTFKFEKINSRPFSLIKVNIDGKEPKEIEKEIITILENKIKKEPNKKQILKVEVSGNLKSGFKPIDLNFGQISSIDKNNAIIEITKSNIKEENSKTAEELRSGIVENMSIHDFGISLFTEKLKSNNYSLKVNPSDLFNILSSEEKKETVIKKAISELFSE
ncbi:MAG: DNA repair exonuclease [Candidatus Micrarchaeaceae archaeon]